MSILSSAKVISAKGYDVRRKWTEWRQPHQSPVLVHTCHPNMGNGGWEIQSQTRPSLQFTMAWVGVSKDICYTFKSF